MKALAYIRGTFPEPDEGGVRAQYRNASLWKGEVEKCDRVYAWRAEILERYGRAGIEAVHFRDAPVEAPREDAVVATGPGEIRPKGGGWFDVYRGGVKVNVKALREDKARELLQSS